MKNFKYYILPILLFVAIISAIYLSRKQPTVETENLTALLELNTEILMPQEMLGTYRGRSTPIPYTNADGSPLINRDGDILTNEPHFYQITLFSENKLKLEEGSESSGFYNWKTKYDGTYHPVVDEPKHITINCRVPSFPLSFEMIIVKGEQKASCSSNQIKIESMDFIDLQKEAEKRHLDELCSQYKQEIFLEQRYNQIGKTIIQLKNWDSLGECAYTWYVICTNDAGSLSECIITTGINKRTMELDVLNVDCERY